MEPLTIITDPGVVTKFRDYPPDVRREMERLRALVVEVATESDTISKLEETLKWGEPSYLVRRGSTLRMDWKERRPEEYALYFKCTSKLVPTIRSRYGSLFRYENNRALLFGLGEALPETELRECIRLALHYHLIKGELT